MENLYEIKKHGHIVYHIRAKSGDSAKRIACKRDGIKASDSWCGTSNYSARKMSAVEAAEWEKGLQETGVFIAGMMELAVKAHKERN